MKAILGLILIGIGIAVILCGVVLLNDSIFIPPVSVTDAYTGSLVNDKTEGVRR